jgi:AraC family transcriptional regulator, arabinose operon regulatory protein
MAIERTGLDDPLVLGKYGPVPLQAGFRNQRLVVVPRPAVRDALNRPVTRRLMVTDTGYYPQARDHEMRRPRGAPETIVIVCSAGTGWARVGQTLHRVSGSMALVIPAGEPHAYGAGRDLPWTIWWCHLAGTDVAELVSFMEVCAARPIVPVSAIERAVALLDEILSNLERDQSPPRLVAASGAAWKLLTQISVDRVMPAPGDPLQRAMTYLGERLDGSVRVPELARLVGISPSHLSAMFRKATGSGVLAHHIALKMARARQLLDQSEASISEIARDVGYHDPFYFSRHFRRHHGVSPSAYRRRD